MLLLFLLAESVLTTLFLISNCCMGMNVLCITMLLNFYVIQLYLEDKTDSWTKQETDHLLELAR